MGFASHKTTSSLIIPLVIALAVFVQVSLKSPWLIIIFVFILLLIIGFVVARFRYHLSPNRVYEKMAEKWDNDVEWLNKWSNRITKQLNMKLGVTESDLYELGMAATETNRVEIIFALHKYFEKNEFDGDLVLLRVKELPFAHPLRRYDAFQEWILLPRKNLVVNSSAH